MAQQFSWQNHANVCVEESHEVLQLNFLPITDCSFCSFALVFLCLKTYRESSLNFLYFR